VDNIAAGPPVPTCFGPDRRLTALAGGLCVLAAITAWRAPSSPGQLLLSLAAAVLFGYAASDLVFAPRLAAGPDGLVVRSPWAWVRLPWERVDAVRADVHHRHGLRSVALEIDAGEQLIVLSRRALGADPEAVATLVRSLDPRRA
jgi:hypothetical protein